MIRKYFYFSGRKNRSSCSKPAPIPKPPAIQNPAQPIKSSEISRVWSIDQSPGPRVAIVKAATLKTRSSDLYRKHKKKPLFLWTVHPATIMIPITPDAANEVRNPRQSSSPQRISDNAAIHALKVPGFIPIL